MPTRRNGSAVLALVLALALACLAAVVVRGEDYVDIPYNVDSVWEFTPFHRYLFSHKREVYQFSYAQQRTIGSLPIASVVVGGWSQSEIAVPYSPLHFVNVTDNGFDCSHVWSRTNRLYHYADRMYLRMRHDGSHSGGEGICTGWWGVPDRPDACFEISVESTVFLNGDYMTTYCSLVDHNCINGLYKIQDVAPGLPSNPSAIIKHPHLGEISESGLAAYLPEIRARPNNNYWITVFKDDQVWMWTGPFGYTIVGPLGDAGAAERRPVTGHVVDGYPQNITQFGRCSGIRYTATPVAELHDGTVSRDGTNDYAYEHGLSCRWVIQPPAWMRVTSEFNGFNFYFRAFQLRNGSSDSLAVWDTSANHTSPQLLYNWTANNAPSVWRVFSFAPTIQRLTFYFNTDPLTPATASLVPALGWQLTYFLQNHAPGTDFVKLYDRPYLSITSGLNDGVAPLLVPRVQSMIIRPASQTSVRTEFALELVSLPNAYVSPFGSNLYRTASNGARCFLEVFEGVAGGPTPMKLIANCSGTNPAVILGHCTGIFAGTATVVLHSLIPASEPGIVAVLGRTDVTATCHGTQNSSAYQALLDDGSGPYFYQSSQVCDWLLYPNEPVEYQFAIAVTAITTATEACCDILSLYDGVTVADSSSFRGQFSGISNDMSAPIFSSSPYARLRFKSDSSFDDDGIVFNYTRLFRPADTPFSSFTGFRSTFQISPSNGGFFIEAAQRSTISIVMRDYLARPIATAYGAVRWYVRFVPHASYGDAAQRLAIAKTDVPIHSLVGDPYSDVVESTSVSATDSSFEFTAPSFVGQYDAFVVAVMNVQVANAVRIVQCYDHSPFVISVGAKTAYGPESVLSHAGPANQLVPVTSSGVVINSTTVATAGDNVRLVIDIHDQFGNPATAEARGELRVLAQSDVLAAKVVVTPVPNFVGRYELSIPVTAAGVYTLSAFVLGLDAKGSPATIVVVPSQIAAAECGLSDASIAFAVVSAELNQVVSYELQARDRFRNPVGGANVPILPLEVRPEMVRGQPDDVSVAILPYNSNNGTYGFTVRAAVRVQAYLHVFVNRTEVSGSPFRFENTLVTVSYEQPAIWSVAFITVSVILCASSIGWLLYLNRHWYHPIMRAASPTFLAAILVASIVAYASVPVIVVYPPTPDTCRASAAMGHLAYCALWSILCLKLWRVAAIVNASRKMADAAPRLTDAVLGRYVLIGLFTVSAYIIIWFAFEPPAPVHISSSALDKTGRELSFIGCGTGHSVFSTVLFVVEGCMLLYGVLLSIQLRAVSSAFAESKWVSAATYNLVVVGSITLGLYQSGAIADSSIVLLLEAVGILYVTFLTIVLLFVPKLLTIRDPQRFMIDMQPSHYPHGGSTEMHPVPPQAGGGGANNNNVNAVAGEAIGVTALSHLRPSRRRPHRRSNSEGDAHPGVMHDIGAIGGPGPTGQLPGQLLSRQSVVNMYSPPPTKARIESGGGSGGGRIAIGMAGPMGEGNSSIIDVGGADAAATAAAAAAASAAYTNAAAHQLPGAAAARENPNRNLSNLSSVAPPPAPRTSVFA